MYRLMQGNKYDGFFECGEYEDIEKACSDAMDFGESCGWLDVYRVEDMQGNDVAYIASGERLI